MHRDTDSIRESSDAAKSQHPLSTKQSHCSAQLCQLFVKIYRMNREPRPMFRAEADQELMHAAIQHASPDLRGCCNSQLQALYNLS